MAYLWKDPTHIRCCLHWILVDVTYQKQSSTSNAELAQFKSRKKNHQPVTRRRLNHFNLKNSFLQQIVLAQSVCDAFHLPQIKNYFLPLGIEGTFKLRRDLSYFHLTVNQTSKLNPESLFHDSLLIYVVIPMLHISCCGMVTRKTSSGLPMEPL